MNPKNEKAFHLALAAFAVAATVHAVVSDLYAKETMRIASEAWHTGYATQDFADDTRKQVEMLDRMVQAASEYEYLHPSVRTR